FLRLPAWKDNVQAEGAANKLLEAMRRFQDPKAISALGRTIAELIKNSNSEAAAKISNESAPRILEAMDQPNVVEDRQTLVALASAIARLEKGVDPAAVVWAAEKILVALAEAKDDGTVYFLAQAVVALARKMDKEGVQALLSRYSL